MNINLHNYEEYFLLYADKELSGEERSAVDDFIKQHPELEEEFEMINSTIMEPENFELKDKSFLLKSTENEFINKANYEEIFVLYHDGELNAEQKSQTNEFLEKHPELEDEFFLFSQAKMQADSISYPDKHSLLKKEHSGITGRIILFRSLAAAAVLGFGLWLTVPYFSESDRQTPVAQQVETPDSPLQKNSASTNIAGTNNSLAANEQVEKSSEIRTEKAESNLKVIPQESNQMVNNKKEIILAKKEKDVSNTPDEEKTIQPFKKEEERGKINEIMIAQIPAREIFAGVIIEKSELAHVDIDLTPKETEKNYTAQNVVNLDVNKEPSGNYILNVPEEEFRKTKIGGFLKQLKRVVDRNDPIKRLFAGEKDR